MKSMMIYENLGESMKLNGKFTKVYENLFNGVTGHSPWGHMGSPRHIGTKTMRMNKLGQTVTAVVDTCVVRKKQSRQFVKYAVACGIYGM